MRPGRRPLLGEILVKKGLLTEDKLKEALDAQKQTTLRIGELLVDLGYVDQTQVLEAVADQEGLKYVDLERFSIDTMVRAYEKVYADIFEREARKQR